jgi:hypothetical protein
MISAQTRSVFVARENPFARLRQRGPSGPDHALAISAATTRLGAQTRRLGFYNRMRRWHEVENVPMALLVDPTGCNQLHDGG